MKPSDLQFCLHNGSVREEDSKYTLITWCPVKYWNDNGYLPDYHFGNDLEDSLPKNNSGYYDLPEGYLWYIGVEEIQWVSEKSPNEIRAELTKLGFTESKDMEDFLTPLWD